MSCFKKKKKKGNALLEMKFLASSLKRVCRESRGSTVPWRQISAARRHLAVLRACRGCHTPAAGLASSAGTPREEPTWLLLPKLHEQPHAEAHVLLASPVLAIDSHWPSCSLQPP